MSAAAPGRLRKFGFTGFGLLCAVISASLFTNSAVAGEVLLIEVKMADARIDPQTKQSIIFVKLTEESKRLVAEMTQKNVGKATEFRLDGRVLMKPIIREPLQAGVFEILGNYSLNEAKDIAYRLSSGGKIEIVVMSE